MAHLRCGDTYAQPAAGFGIGIATVYRCIREAVEALSASLRPWPRRCGRSGRRRSSSSTAPCCRSTASPPTPPTTQVNTSATA
ncbi:transposase family protein [Streptomyces hydrogenans]|uniref:transposase family protein n=1 Tax=Streptomyces hydrogenans TaxID=1873719 RepID=UPI0036539425